MADSDHGETPPAPLFCVVRKPNAKCGCPENNNYIADNKPPPTWNPYIYSQTVVDKETLIKSKTATICQRHHIVCCSSSQKLLAAEDQVKRVVEATQWCVNKKSNILTMPLWGNTLKYYCTFSSAQWLLKRLPTLPPPFNDIPQHDSDHPRYTKEVNIDIKDLEDDLKEQAKAHQLTSKMVAGALDGLADKWIGELAQRGVRCGGTHLAWKGGKSGTNPQWYLPFSMTSTGLATQRTFPLRGSDSEMLAKLDKMAQAVKAWGF
jgi:hypothetical protein